MKYFALMIFSSMILFDCDDNLTDCGSNDPPSGGGGNGGGTARDSAIVLESSDGGRTWYNLYTIDEATSLDAVSGPATGGQEFVVGGTDTAGNAILLTSHDAGFEWTRRYTGGPGSVDNLEAAGAHVFALTGSSLLRSTDFGVTWNEVASAPDLNGISFHGVTGFAIGGQGDLLRTTDFGETWVNMPNPSVTPLFRSIANQDNTVIAVGWGNPSIGGDFPVYYSFDTGMTWLPAAHSTGFCTIPNGEYHIESVKFVDFDEAIFVTDGDFNNSTSRTINSGATWCGMSEPMSNTDNFRDIVTGEDHILIVGDEGIWWSENKGFDWEEAYTSDPGVELKAAFFPSFPLGYGVAVGVRHP